MTQIHKFSQYSQGEYDIILLYIIFHYSRDINPRNHEFITLKSPFSKHSGHFGGHAHASLRVKSSISKRSARAEVLNITLGGFNLHKYFLVGTPWLPTLRMRSTDSTISVAKKQNKTKKMPVMKERTNKTSK